MILLYLSGLCDENFFVMHLLVGRDLGFHSPHINTLTQVEYCTEEQSVFQPISAFARHAQLIKAFLLSADARVQTY